MQPGSDLILRKEFSGPWLYRQTVGIGEIDMSEPKSLKLPVIRVAAAAAITAAIFYALCWLGTLLPMGPATHMYLQLFASGDITSGAALAQGVCWSLAFGLIGGGLFALIYNAFAGIERG